MLLEINIGLRKNGEGNKYFGSTLFFEPQIFEICSGNLAQFRMPFNSHVVMAITHINREIQHLSLAGAFHRPTARLLGNSF